MKTYLQKQFQKLKFKITQKEKKKSGKKSV